MKFVVQLTMPNEPFNSYIKEGTAGSKIGRVMEETKPESAYFTATPDGTRGGILIYNLENASEIPAMAEPWFIQFNAKLQFTPCMTPEDLGKAGLDDLGKKWA
jgi:hypothetical protein